MGCHNAVATAKMENKWMDEPTMYSMNAFMNSPLNGDLAMSMAFLLNNAELSAAEMGDDCTGQTHGESKRGEGRSCRSQEPPPLPPFDARTSAWP